MAVLVSLTVFSGCKEDEEQSLETTTSISRDHSFVEFVYTEAQLIVDQARFGDLQTFKTLGCASITRDTVSATRSIIVNFGNKDCNGPDDVERRGKIIANWTGKYNDVGTEITITFDQYYVNDNRILGSRKIKNTGRNNEGKLSYTVEIDGKVLLVDANDELTYKSTRTRRWINGDGTSDRNDDSFEIIGSGKGVSAQGREYNVTIIEPILIKMSCKFITKGVMEISPKGREKRIVNYGEGECDNRAKVFINSVEYNIELRSY